MKHFYLRFNTLSKRTILFAIFLLAGISAAFGTHNRAGEITFKQLTSLTFEITVTTYTKTSSVAADRDSLLVNWGDGTSSWVVRSVEVPLPNDIKFNQYIGTHTYPAQSTYTVSITDPNRNGGILNVNPPQSDQIPFHLETLLSIVNTQFQGFNSSPQLLQPPIDVAYVGQPFVHNPNAYDPEGDSLSYQLIVPLQDVNTPVSNYLFPNQVSQPGLPVVSVLELNPITGDLLWDAPQIPGEYNIAMRIDEYRNGVKISSIIRDMQITVRQGDNRPPKIESPQEICVVAGELINFEVIATDPDLPPQDIELTALGGPFLLDISPATFTAPEGYSSQPVIGVFEWQTTCEHIRKQPYTLVVKATDWYETSPTGDPIGLSSLRTIRITVVGPPPEDLQAEVETGDVNLSWEMPYFCEDAANDYFTGFSVWRREGSNAFEVDSCTPGLAGRGYTRIANNLTDNDGNRYMYTDENLERGRFYCYRILANFAQRTPVGLFYNLIESLPSLEVCVQLSRDLPIITLADVITTDAENGVVEVQWSKPDAEDLDTIQNPGPYFFELYRAQNLTGQNRQLIYTSAPVNTFSELTDTIYIDEDLNTLQFPHTYIVEFYVEGNVSIGESGPGSTVFLQVGGTDQANVLTWAENVPWDNTVYDIFKWNETTESFDSIASVPQPPFTDQGLINGIEYCYFVRSTGSFSVEGLPTPIINHSQIACGVPIDTIPPCPPPNLTVENECPTADERRSGDTFFNWLNWSNPNTACADTDDAMAYNIYYAPFQGADFTLIQTIGGAENTYFEHTPDHGNLAGCYAVAALDSFANESNFSDIVCIDNCPVYILPNVFTPNGDGHNDLFIPFPFRFIESIDFKVYNRWGQLVFQTTDPQINWDGTNLQGSYLEQGTYYYVCHVVESRLDGQVPRQEHISGYIHLLR